MVPATPTAAPPTNPAATPSPRAFLENPFFCLYLVAGLNLVPQAVPYPGLEKVLGFFLKTLENLDGLG